jgi:hypothetical protein
VQTLFQFVEIGRGIAFELGQESGVMGSRVPEGIENFMPLCDCGSVVANHRESFALAAIEHRFKRGNSALRD